MEWVPYMSLERTEMLRAGGREMLGKILYWTEKRDGSNISVWLSPDVELGGKELDTVSVGGQDYKVVISSRNQKVAAGSFANLLRSLPEYNKVVEYLKEFPKTVVFGELVSAGHTPARCEPVHKRASYSVFDIYDREFDVKSGRFLSYNAMYQQMYHFKVPTVKLVGITRHTKLHMTEEEKARVDKEKLFDLFDSRSGYKKAVIEGNDMDSSVVDGDSYYYICELMIRWAKVHRREGVVVKAFDGLEPIYVKEKIDLPRRVKVRSVSQEQGVQLPPLPMSEVMGAINKVHVDNGDDFIMDKSKAMPAIARAIGEECKKHLCSQPTGKIFEYYLEYVGGLKVPAK